MDWTNVFMVVFFLGWLVTLYVIFRVSRRQTFKRKMREKGFSEKYIKKAVKDEGF